jgi:hypothetical protein
MTRKLKCTCSHDYQDKAYGKGVRIYNDVAKIANTWRCTVCSRQQVQGEAAVKKK